MSESRLQFLYHTDITDNLANTNLTNLTNMDLHEINSQLIEDLLRQAKASERLRVAYDLRTTPEDTSQRMLNALMPGTEVPIHQHEETSETNICIVGRLDVVFYDKGTDGGFVESSRVALNPKAGAYGVQIPKGAWHTVEVIEPCVIFEGKDGAYKG